MKQVIKPRLVRIFLILGCLIIPCGIAGAQSVPRVRPGNSEAVPIKRISLSETSIQGYTSPNSRPMNMEATGTVGLTFNANQPGEIEGDVIVIGFDPNLRNKELNDAQKQTVRSFVENGLSYWGFTSANICGSQITIKPKLKLEFPYPYTGPVDGKNLLYIMLEKDNLGRKGGGREMGRFLPAVFDSYARWTARFGRYRGMGTIPPFTIIMPDPDKVKVGKYFAKDGSEIRGDFAWEMTMAHEFGHGLGFHDTYKTSDLSTNEVPIGIMNALRYQIYEALPAYTAELITRVFECRIDITTSLDKKSVSSAAILSNKWDFTGTMVSKYSDVLTSQWAYFNGRWRLFNSCTIPNNRQKLGRIYRMCDAMGNNNADEIDFNLGARKQPAYYVWEKESSFPSEPVQNLQVGEGDCNDPVSSKNGNGSRPLEYIKPDFRLGSDGVKTWILEVYKYEKVMGDTTAVDPKPLEGPVCKSGFTWTGKTLPKSNEFGPAPITAGSSLIEDGREVGEYQIKVEMKLGLKK